MAHSFKTLSVNFQKYFNIFYSYLLRGMYWGSVPAIILYGLFSKPQSPIVLSAWAFLTGQEEQQQNESPYGMSPGMGGYQ